ncbi:MAG: BACON domain-containing protein [Alistipes sp.]|nr:BACON domain-containing protein [Alistipes sp.]MBO7243651.1 BACON domain-containing protein [Alistipes sp.]
MKRLFFGVATVVAALVSLCSCERGGETVKESGIILYNSEIEVGVDAATLRFNYDIKNRIEGVNLEVSCAEEWITIDKIGETVVQYLVDENSGAERVATLNLTYGSEKNSLKIRQQGYVAPLALTVETADATSVTFSVAAHDEETTWIGQIVGKEWFEGFTTEELLYEDMRYYNGVANEMGITLEEYLSSVLSRGSHSGIRMSGLDPETDYVVYIYGLTAKGEVTSRLFHAEFSTEAPYEGNDVTYDINVEVNRAIAKISIQPSHEGVAYFNNLITREDFEAYGGDINKAADGVIQKIIEDYAAWDYTLAETFEYNTDYLATEYEFEAMANTEYVAFAFKWNEKCERLSEVSYKWFEVGEIAPSENVITMEISNVTQSTFDIVTTTTNLDPYVIFPIPAMDIAKMRTDDAIFEYILNTYGTSSLVYYQCEGDVEGTFSGLEAGTEYAVLAFGYEAGTLTTAIVRENITTAEAGDVDACVYTIEVSDIGDREAQVSIRPSDFSIYYYWNVFEASMTEEEIKNYILSTYNSAYYGDYWEFSYYELAQGNVESSISQLKPSTDYKIVVIPMNPNTFEYVGTMREGGYFTTEEAIIADITITAGFDAYYDGDEVYELEPQYCSSWKGWVVVPMSVNIEGEFAGYLYTMFSYVEGLENPEIYSDNLLIDNLYNVGAYWSPAYFRGEWDKTVMIAAVAFDYDGNPSPVYRSVHTFTRDGASDAQEFVDYYMGTITTSSAVVKHNLDAAVLSTPESSYPRREMTKQQRSIIFVR